jgi:hypothetical protein
MFLLSLGVLGSWTDTMLEIFLVRFWLLFFYSLPFPGRYKLRASHPDYDIEMRGSPKVNISYILVFH